MLCDRWLHPSLVSWLRRAVAKLAAVSPLRILLRSVYGEHALVPGTWLWTRSAIGMYDRHTPPP